MRCYNAPPTHTPTPYPTEKNNNLLKKPLIYLSIDSIPTALIQWKGICLSYY